MKKVLPIIMTVAKIVGVIAKILGGKKVNSDTKQSQDDTPPTN